MAPPAHRTPWRFASRACGRRRKGVGAAAACRLDTLLPPCSNASVQFWTKVWSPLGDLLLRLGVSPNTVTLVGTLGVCAGALIFFPQGWLLAGVLVITVFVFSDMIDGYMARTSGQISPFGAFLDSTLDRIGDAAIFGGLALYYVGPGDNELAGRARDLLPHDGLGHVVRPGPGGVARHAGEGRHRRAIGPARARSWS